MATKSSRADTPPSVADGSDSATTPARQARRTGIDPYSKEKRSAVMRSVPTKNTKPEIVVRSVLHALGYRFRLHRRDLPGSPDIVLPKHRTVVFVHGCFWHRHPGCRLTTTPAQNAEFWQAKFERNEERDRAAAQKLQELGWRVVIVWECEVKKGRDLLSVRLQELLSLER